MGTKINDIIQVDITRGAATVTKAGFGTLMIVGPATFPELIKTYSNSSALDDDLDSGLITNELHTAGVAAFSQSVSPNSIKIGKRSADSAQTNIVTVTVVANNTQYDVTLEGVLYSYTSDADATNLEIAAGLVSAINLGAGAATATDNLDGTFDIVADVAGVPFTIAVGAGLTQVESVANVSISTTLSDLEQADIDWYAFNIIHGATIDAQETDIKRAAAWVESRRKIYLTSSQDSELLTTSVANAYGELKTLAYDRTFSMYQQLANTQYPESALCGRCLPEDAGSINWKFKQLVGVTASSLTDTNIVNLKAKNINYYESVLGVSCITSDAIMASGEYIDVIRGSDWLQAEIEEGLFTVLLNVGKVPFTDDGINMIVSPLREALDAAVSRGYLSSYTINQPKSESVSSVDKAARLLKNITFTGNLAGAVNKAVIEGTLSV